MAGVRKAANSHSSLHCCGCSCSLSGHIYYGAELTCKSVFVERFPEFSLFYRLFSPLDSEMICIFPYFYPCEESAREIREIFI